MHMATALRVGLSVVKHLICISALAILAPTPAFACPACAANAGDGYVYATLLLLLVPFALVGALGWWFLKSAQRSNSVNEEV